MPLGFSKADPSKWGTAVSSVYTQNRASEACVEDREVSKNVVNCSGI